MKSVVVAHQLTETVNVVRVDAVDKGLNSFVHGFTVAGLCGGSRTVYSLSL